MGKYSASVVGIGIAWLLAMVLTPPNASAGLGDYNYCDPIFCGAGEGDCDGNFDCQAGLVCVNDQGAYYQNFPPPSANYDPSIVDVCEAPNPDLCRDFGPCPAGNGDCDSNSECQAGLTCVADVGAKYGYPAYYDVCESGGPIPDPDYCLYNYCGIGDGDCEPGQCNEGYCATDVGARYGLPAYYDVCESGGPIPDPDYCLYNYCGIGDGDCEPGQCNEGYCATDVGARYGLPAYYDVCESGGPIPDPDYCLYNYCGIGDGDCEPGQCDEGYCATDVGARYGLPAYYDVCEAEPVQSTLDLSIEDACLDGLNIEYRFFEDAVNVSPQSSRWPGRNQVYVTSFGQTHTTTLSCTPGYKVCYGARPQGGSGYWGVGIDATESCIDCCTTCPASGTTTHGWRLRCS